MRQVGFCVLYADNVGPRPTRFLPASSLREKSVPARSLAAAAKPGHRTRRPFRRNMHRWIELADGIDAGGLDGDLHVRRHGPWTEANDTNASFAALLVSAARQHQYSSLAGAIMTPALQRACRRAGADVDDNSAPLTLHDRNGRAHGKIHALVVDVGDARPLFGVGAGQTRDRLDQSGVVDENIETPEFRLASRDGFGDVGIGADVADARQGSAADPPDFFRKLFNRSSGAGAKHDRDISASKFPCHARADAATGPRDDRYLSAQFVLWHRFTLSFSRPDGR